MEFKTQTVEWSYQMDEDTKQRLEYWLNQGYEIKESGATTDHEKPFNWLLLIKKFE